MESLLAMPIAPVEIMLGKILPYVLVGFVQGTLVLGAAVVLFGVPVAGSLAVLAALSILFITTNLSIGYTFSTLPAASCNPVQMVMMFFLPEHPVVRFAFPFAGMPGWAQWISEALPLTHYLRIVRAIMLKGSSLGRPPGRSRVAHGPDARRHDDRGHPLPAHSGLMRCPEPSPQPSATRRSRASSTQARARCSGKCGTALSAS